MNRSMENLVFYPRRQEAGERYADRTMDPGFLQYTNVRELLAQFFLQTHFHLTKVPNWREMCIGVTSMYPYDHRTLERHGSAFTMPMYDYDGRHARSTLKKDVTLLQERYGLGPAWIYKTKRGCHVYFFCDAVPQREALRILEDVNCCEGFKRSTQRRGHSVLRLSAKYTDFDIEFDSIIPDPSGQLKRKTSKAHVIEHLLGLGKECGTHFAKLFPQWAHYKEDPKPWRPPRKRDPHEKGKLLRKVVDIKVPKVMEAMEAPAAHPVNVDPDYIKKMEQAVAFEQVLANKKVKFAQMYGNQKLYDNWSTTTSVSVSGSGMSNNVWYTYTEKANSEE